LPVYHFIRISDIIIVVGHIFVENKPSTLLVLFKLYSSCWFETSWFFSSSFLFPSYCWCCFL